MKGTVFDDSKNAYQASNKSSYSALRPVNDKSEAVIRMLEKRVSERQAKIRQQVEDAVRERHNSPQDDLHQSILDKYRENSNKKLEVSYESTGSKKIPNRFEPKKYDSDHIKYKSEPNVFDRLTADAKRKQAQPKKEPIPRTSIISFHRSEDRPRIEDRLIGYQREHQNWIAKQRLLKKSKELDMLYGTPQPNLTRSKRPSIESFKLIDFTEGLVFFITKIS